MSKYKVGDIFFARVTFVDMQGIKVYNGCKIELTKELGSGYYDCNRDAPAYVTIQAQINDYELDTYCTDSGQLNLPIGSNTVSTPNSLLADELGWGEISFIGDSDPSDFFPIAPQRKCECGSTAVGSDKHSTWCPLHA